MFTHLSQPFYYHFERSPRYQSVKASELWSSEIYIQGTSVLQMSLTCFLASGDIKQNGMNQAKLFAVWTVNWGGGGGEEGGLSSRTVDGGFVTSN